MNYTEKQTFKLTYDWWEIEIEIDFGFPNVMKNITDMIYFWGDGDERLDENNGDYVTTFLKQLAIKCLWLQCQNFVGANLVALFKNKSKCEGYCDMDGSYGIKILNYDVWGFSLDDLSIEVAATEA